MALCGRIMTVPSKRDNAAEITSYVRPNTSSLVAEMMVLSVTVCAQCACQACKMTRVDSGT